MKTLEEFYEEIKTNDELKKELAKAAKAGKVTEFLKAHDCDSTAEELKEFIKGKTAKDTPLQLTDEELNLVAGGRPTVNLTNSRGCNKKPLDTVGECSIGCQYVCACKS